MNTSNQHSYAPNNNPQYIVEDVDPPPPYVDVVSRTSLEKRRSVSSDTSSVNNEDFLTQALDFTQHVPPRNISEQPLRQPVIIPQVGSGFGLPFARGYSPDLEAHGVSMEEFVEFIDNYNVVSNNSKPFAILDLAGGVVGFVPIHHAQLISGAISLASHAGNLAVAALKKSKADKYIETANKDFFIPRGLTVSIASSEAVKSKLEMDLDAPLAAPHEESDGLSVHERRMLSVQGYAAPVTFDVPPPSEETNVLRRMAASQQKRNMEKKEKKALEDRRKYADKKAEADQKISEKGTKAQKQFQKLEESRQKHIDKRDKELSKLNAEMDKEARKKDTKDADSVERKRMRESEKIEKEFQKEVRELDKEKDKVEEEYNMEVRKESSDAQKDDKEIKASNKILWILVEAHKVDL